MDEPAKSPDRVRTLTPYFTVADADRLITFLIAAFDASLVKENRTKDNRIQHARLRIGDCLLMLNDASDTYPPTVSQMHLYVDNADLTYARALELGATPLMEPNTRPHGDRMAGVKDPCGNIWWIATHC